MLTVSPILSVAVDPARAAALAWNPHLPQQPEPPGLQISPSPNKKKPSKVARQLAGMTPADPAAVGQGGPGPIGQPAAARMKRITNTDDVYTIHKTAEGALKFRCKMCHRCFNLKCTLLRHVRHQHQGRFVPHPCPQCGQVFKRTDHLKVHLKKIHQIEQLSSRQQARLAEAAGQAGEAGPGLLIDEGEEGDIGSPSFVGEIAESPIAADEELEEEIAEPVPA